MGKSFEEDVMNNAPDYAHTYALDEQARAIKRLTEECHGRSVRAGWYNDPETGETIARNLPEMMALEHSEIFRTACYRSGAHLITYDLRSAYPYSLTERNPMATKEQGGSSCYEKAAPDEPVFALRAQDSLAPEIVREWAFRAQVAGTPADKVAEARKVADDMEQWQIVNMKKVLD